MNETPKQSIKERYDTPQQVTENFRRWHNAMEASHAMLMAGLRNQVGPDGDIREAYRQWNALRRARKMEAYARSATRIKNVRFNTPLDRLNDPADAT